MTHRGMYKIVPWMIIRIMIKTKVILEYFNYDSIKPLGNGAKDRGISIIRRADNKTVTNKENKYYICIHILE